MDDSDRPGRVREPVDHSPRGVADEPSQQAGHDDGHEELGCDRAQAEPEGAVVRRERDDRAGPAEVGERVHHRGDDVQGEEDERHHGHVAVQPGGEEGGPPRSLEAQRRQHPEDHDRGQQNERHGAGRPRRVPEQLVGHGLGTTGDRDA